MRVEPHFFRTCLGTVALMSGDWTDCDGRADRAFDDANAVRTADGASGDEPGRIDDALRGFIPTRAGR